MLMKVLQRFDWGQWVARAFLECVVEYSHCASKQWLLSFFKHKYSPVGTACPIRVRTGIEKSYYESPKKQKAEPIIYRSKLQCLRKD